MRLLSASLLGHQAAMSAPTHKKFQRTSLPGHALGAKGDRAEAAAALRHLVKAGHKDDLLYLTVKIALERLEEVAVP